MFKCKICNKEYTTINQLHSHITGKEHLTMLKYYITYENFQIPKCKFCENEAKHKRGLNFYQTCCGKNCITKNNKTKIHTNETKKQLSISLKLAIKEGRAKGWNNCRNKQKLSYPEEFFIKIIENEFNDKNYIKEYPFGIYSIDFAWPHKKLAIEIDGKQHEWEERKISDIKKDKLLNENSWKVMRIKWKDFIDNTQHYIQMAKDFIDENFKLEDYYLNIYDNYKIELDFELLRNKLGFEIKQSKIGNRKILYNEKEIENKIQLILNSNIDFYKFGWVGKVSEILNITPQNVNRWMKRNMLEFYNEKCFKKKQK